MSTQHDPVQLQTLLIMLLVVSLIPASASAYASNYTAGAPPPAALLACLPSQAAALLQLRRSFSTTANSIAAFRSWKAGTSCCRWRGVRCDDGDGRVTSLDLSNRGLQSDAMDSALFSLTSLRYLNLAYNDFNGSQLPSTGFEQLAMLTHLNLSTSSFDGLIPAGIGRLTNLVSLDLSTDFHIVDLPDDNYVLDLKSDYSFTESNFEALISNLTELREIYLGRVDLSSNGAHRCNALAKFSPKLQVLSLPYCRLFGTICASLSSLHSLSVIDLNHNHLSGPIPDFLINFTRLSVLQLRRNNLEGWVSPIIFQHRKLITLDLSQNLGISGSLPNFSSDSSLENLSVSRTNLSGIIPSSISNLKSLKKLGLGASGFFGELPSSIGGLKSLDLLDISGLQIVGSIPLWVANLTTLTTLRFFNCGLSGPIPSFVGALIKLRELMLHNCQFSGNIPPHISNITHLQMLLLPSNNFSGKIEIAFIWKLHHLQYLDISHNNLDVVDREYNSSLVAIPKLVLLDLSSCNITKFPNFLRHQDEIERLNISDNYIHGAIPEWAWENWNEISILSLSHNSFTVVGHDPLLPFEINILDLSNNLFEGTIPIPQGFPKVVDYSNNKFSSIPINFTSHVSDFILFDAHENNFSGDIPLSFCGATTLQLLDLSYNNFSGSIPSCLMENVRLGSLKLRSNHLHGEIPDNFIKDCSLGGLDLGDNLIKGRLPRSLVACKNLEVFDVGNNQISDSFPCWMSALHMLQVLVLKSNMFFGQVVQSIAKEKSTCEFASARIVDLSSNNFFGSLPKGIWFKKLKSMILKDPNAPQVMAYKFPNARRTYRYTTTITYKGHDTTFSTILTALTLIDVSNNAFNGSIPKEIGELVLLNNVNMSQNFLIGPIPSQLGHLKQLESLDLSSNELSREIPEELASLDFLTTLNLSYNKLEGRIPQPPHFSTFPNTSFLGNSDLCGPPLSKQCSNTTMANVVTDPVKKSIDVMLFLFIGLGFGAGFAVAIVLTCGGLHFKKTSHHE